MGFLRVFLGVLLCFNLFIIGCARPVSPGALIDDLGREVTLDHYPERIVSLAPSNTEILFALGLGDKVVSVTDMCDYPEEAKSKPELDGFEPSIEFIVGQNPDLVMAIGEYPDLISKMEAQNLTIVALQPKGINGVIKDIELVGKLTGTDKKAKILADDMRKYEKTVAKHNRHNRWCKIHTKSILYNRSWLVAGWKPVDSRTRFVY
ncbi:MAG: ABC transporter substrate-binding protein [Chloroflexi bacterium]|nr:ABC transporter substrate-binding protein [Chloroflexota bacterium]